MIIEKLKTMEVFELYAHFKNFLELSEYGKMVLIRDEVAFRRRNKLIHLDDRHECEQIMLINHVNSKGIKFNFSQRTINEKLSSDILVGGLDKKEKRKKKILTKIRKMSILLDKRDFMLSNFSY